MTLSKNMQLAVLNGVMDFAGRHPLLIKALLRPVANAPLLGKRMMVFPRAFMGASAFEIHDVDLKAGRIGIGGVEEIMAGAKIIHLLHDTLAERVGEMEKNEALYEMGRRLCEWEVTQALEGGRWAPAALTPLIHNANLLEEVQSDPAMARFFGNVMKMMSKLITDEGGWGHLEFDFSSFPLKVMLTNSQEARWLGPSDKPVCRFYAGIVAGYAGAISGEKLVAKETECAAMGATQCVFEITREI